MLSVFQRTYELVEIFPTIHRNKLAAGNLQLQNIKKTIGFLSCSPVFCNLLSTSSSLRQLFVVLIVSEPH